MSTAQGQSSTKRTIIPAVVNFTAELKALRQFEREGSLPSGVTIEELLKVIVEKAQPRLDVIKKLHERYSLEYVPIFDDRDVCDPMDIDNRVNNDFFSLIVNEKAGYFSGNPMTFAFESSDKAVAEHFDRFKVRTRLDDVNYETTKNCAIGGYDARLIYIKSEIVGYETNGEPIYEAVEAIKQIPAYETILLGENGYDEPEFGIRAFTYEGLPIGKEEAKEMFRVELYMPRRAYIFEGEALDELSPSTDYGIEIFVDENSGTTAKANGIIEYPFMKCPLYGYENNAELLGDAEPVLSLIDDYDTGTSDTSSELEANRGAYLALIGVSPPKDGDFDSKSNGTLYLKNQGGPDGVKQDAKFITKELPVAAKEAHLERLENNIYLFSQTPNLTEKKTGSAVSGEALRQRMMPMENKTASFERKVVSGNIRMLECLKDFYKFKYNLEFDPYTVTQTFKRKMPENLTYEAEIIELFKNYLPMDKVYSLVSFVDNPREAAEWYEQHQLEKQGQIYANAGGGVNDEQEVPRMDRENITVTNEQKEQPASGPTQAT